MHRNSTKCKCLSRALTEPPKFQLSSPPNLPWHQLVPFDLLLTPNNSHQPAWIKIQNSNDLTSYLKCSQPKNPLKQASVKTDKHFPSSFYATASPNLFITFITVILFVSLVLLFVLFTFMFLYLRKHRLAKPLIDRPKLNSSSMNLSKTSNTMNGLVDTTTPATVSSLTFLSSSLLSNSSQSPNSQSPKSNSTLTYNTESSASNTPKDSTRLLSDTFLFYSFISKKN
jgi:hypothetical protein